MLAAAAMGPLRPYSAAVVAVLVHAAILVAVLHVPARAPPPARSAELPPVEIDVDESRTDVPSEPVQPEGRVAAAGESTAARAATSGTSGAAERPTRAAPQEVAGAASGAPTFELPAPVVPLTPAELGLAGGSNPFVSSSAAAAPAGERPRPAVEQATRDALHASDSLRGLGPEGPAVTALRDATSSSLAPLNGRALFDVRASADGEVLGIDLVEASGGSGWDDAKRIALEALRGKKLSLPRSAKGANIRIEIVSEMSYPSGQKKKVEFGIRPGDNDMPELVLPDESNIGQRPTRKVHARAIGTHLF